MQELSDKIGEHQFARIGVTCMDCNKEFQMNMERTSTTCIEIKNGAIGKRYGDYIFKCPECFRKSQDFGQDCEVYSRVVGYLRPISNWNPGKKEEYKIRKNYAMPELWQTETQTKKPKQEKENEW